MKTRDTNPTVIKALSDKLPLGKYKGQTVRSVIEFNPDYILWLDENVKTLKFAQDILDVAEEASIEQTFDDAIHSHLDHNYSSYYDD